MSSNSRALSGMFERIDFQTPRRPGLSSSKTLQRWHSEICTRTLERWESLLPDAVQLAPHSIVPSVARQAYEMFPADGVGAHLELGGTGLPTLLVASSRLSRAIVESVLSIQGEDWPESGPLTPGEMAILEILFENIADALSESWPGGEPISCRLVETFYKPQRSRLFTPQTELLVLTSQLGTRYGEEQLFWLVPKQDMEDLIAQEFGPTTIKLHTTHTTMSLLAEKLSVEIRVELGMAVIKMSEAAVLTVGDCILLDQSIHKPLSTYVGESLKWKVNPVVVGKRIGFQVANVSDD